jgi:two-component system, chemotaxis family, sensor kinase Cph1
MRVINLNKLLEEVLANFEFQIKSNNIRIKKTKLPVAWADKGMLNQAISNVISNAIKYMDSSREGNIDIEGREEEQFVVISITDNGIGIEPRFFDKIFELFHRTHPDRLDGDGLGLSVVKKILEMNLGKITVESEPGKGSCFCIYLQKPNQNQHS